VVEAKAHLSFGGTNIKWKYWKWSPWGSWYFRTSVLVYVRSTDHVGT